MDLVPGIYLILAGALVIALVLWDSHKGRTVKTTEPRTQAIRNTNPRKPLYGLPDITKQDEEAA